MYLFLLASIFLLAIVIYVMSVNSKQQSSENHQFYNKLRKSLPKGYSLMVQVKLKDLIYFISDLNYEEHLEIINRFKNEKADFIISNNSPKITCFVNIGSNSSSDFAKEQVINALSMVLNVPCFNFKKSSKYNFKYLLDFLNAGIRIESKRIF